MQNAISHEQLLPPILAQQIERDRVFDSRLARVLAIGAVGSTLLILSYINELLPLVSCWPVVVPLALGYLSHKHLRKSQHLG